MYLDEYGYRIVFIYMYIRMLCPFEFTQDGQWLTSVGVGTEHNISVTSSSVRRSRRKGELDGHSRSLTHRPLVEILGRVDHCGHV